MRCRPGRKSMEYSEFLEARRHLMASIRRRGFVTLQKRDGENLAESSGAILLGRPP